MIALPQKYILNITSIFYFYLYHPVTNYIVYCSTLINGLMLHLMPPKPTVHVRMRVMLWNYLSACITPRHNTLLDIYSGTTYRLLARAGHMLPNPAPVFLCDASLYNSLLFSYSSACITLSLNHSMVGFHSLFSIHRETFLTTPSKGPAISSEALYPIMLFCVFVAFITLNLLHLLFMHLIYILLF